MTPLCKATVENIPLRAGMEVEVHHRTQCQTSSQQDMWQSQVENISIGEL